MRDLLNDLEAGRASEADPMRSAQANMRKALPERFYDKVEIGATDTGFNVLLDGRTVKTPTGTPLDLPTEAAAHLVADEYAAQDELIDPSTMPATRLVNTVIDGVREHAQAVLEDILRFSGTDLVCYRAESPQALVEKQAEAWDPVLDWARDTMGAHFVLAEGVMHVEQPRAALTAVSAYLRPRSDPFRVGALHLMTSLTGSALLALAVEARAMTAAEAWSAAHVDEDWNIAQWGEDAEAIARRKARERDMMGAARLLAALDEEKV